MAQAPAALAVVPVEAPAAALAVAAELAVVAAPVVVAPASSGI
jgi:hypothetical protein